MSFFFSLTLARSIDHRCFCCCWSLLLFCLVCVRFCFCFSCQFQNINKFLLCEFGRSDGWMHHEWPMRENATSKSIKQMHGKWKLGCFCCYLPQKPKDIYQVYNIHESLFDRRRRRRRSERPTNNANKPKIKKQCNKQRTVVTATTVCWIKLQFMGVIAKKYFFQAP